ncbi:MAG: DMT family transporter, partial [Collinsella sp.]
GSSLTSASTAGFLQSLTVVIVPFANAALLRRAPERKVLVGTAIVTCGMLLLSGADFTSLNPGAIIMLLSAFIYASHIIVAKRFVEEVDPLALGVWQLGFGGLFSGIAAFTFGGFTLPGTPSEIVVVVALALICSAYGFITQTPQPHVPPRPPASPSRSSRSAPPSSVLPGRRGPEPHRLLWRRSHPHRRHGGARQLAPSRTWTGSHGRSARARLVDPTPYTAAA